MSAVTINVGGRLFAASRATLERSPELSSILARERKEQVFIDRDPRVFSYILAWLRNPDPDNVKLYIDRPDDVTYELLCDDAKHYKLPALQQHLENRINLCRYIYFLSGGKRLLCNLQAFRVIAPSNGVIDRLISEGPSSETIIEGDTIVLHEKIGHIAHILLEPHIPREGSMDRAEFNIAHAFLGDRIKLISGSNSAVEFAYAPTSAVH